MSKKALIAFLIPFIFATEGASASLVENQNSGKPFATFNDLYYEEGKLKEKYYGDLAAVTGTVIEQHFGPNELPILRLKLEAINKTFWIGSVVKFVDGQINVGDTLDVLGFFDQTKNEQEYIAKLSVEPEYLLGFCYNVHGSGLPVYSVQLMKRCLDWERGLAFDEATKALD